MTSLIRSRARYAFAGWGMTKDWDIVPSNSRYAELEKNDTESGWTRIKKIFSTDEYRTITPESEAILQATFFGAFFGGTWGGFLHSKSELFDFLENNEATKFRNQYDAKRLLQDNVIISFAKGVFKWGLRVGFFCGSFVAVSTMISVYRGKTSLIEYSAAGLTSGALYKTHLGPKGMISGGFVGTIFGTVYGIISIIILKLTGTTMQELRYTQYQYAESTDEVKLEVLKKYRMKEAQKLMKETHEKFAMSADE